MKRRHLALSDIAAETTFTQDDPRRRHLEACARCRTLRERYRQFVAPPGDLPAAELRDAEVRLAEWLAARVAPSDTAGRPPQPAEAIRGRIRARLRPAGWRNMALAIAAVALVVAGAFLVRLEDGPWGRASGVLRGAAVGGNGEPLRQLAPLAPQGGRVRLGWRSDPAADRYEVHLYSPELRTLAVLGAGRETVLVLQRGTVAGAVAGDTLLWRVVAFRGEVSVAKTRLGIVRLP